MRPSTCTYKTFIQNTSPSMLMAQKKTRDDNCVAAGMYIPGHNMAVSWRLHPDHSILGAELFAIFQALSYIDTKALGNSIIFSDSKSSLQLLVSPKNGYHEISSKIKRIFMKFNSTRRVILHWVKAHAGVVGNELADTAANLGHGVDKSLLYPLNLEELSTKLKKRQTS